MFTLHSTDPKDPGLVSVNAISNDVLKGHALFSVFVRDRSKYSTTNDTMSQNLANLLTKYQDVFPDKLRKGLPPARVQDFHIE